MQRSKRWHKIDCFIAGFACLLSGKILAFFYLVVPWFFGLLTLLYALRVLAQFRAWWRIPSQERSHCARPGHLMNFNHALSPWMEWTFFALGCAMLLVWIKVAPLLLH